MSQIYDLGYRRYVGTRQPPSTRWRVILRAFLAHAWKTRWRFKASLVMTLIATVAMGVVLYTTQSDIFRGVVGQAGAAQVTVKVADALIPLAYAFGLCQIAFLVCLTVGATAIAGDASSGAFTFYFSRPVRPIDYVLGKLSGLLILLGITLIAPPFLLSLLRLGLSQSTGELLHNLPLLGKSVIVGAMSTMAYASTVLGISAIAGKARDALIVWTAYYVVAGGIFSVMGGPASAFDIKNATLSLSMSLYDLSWNVVESPVPATWSAISLVFHGTAPLLLAYFRVRDAQGKVGGGS